MKLDINYNGGVLSLPADILNDIESLGETEIKVLLYLCSPTCDKNNFNFNAGCTKLGISPSDFENAVSFWRGAGIIKLSGKGAKGPRKIKDENEDKTEPKTKDIKVISQKEPEKKEDKTAHVTVITNSPPQYTGKELDRIVSSNSAVDKMRRELEGEKMLNRPLKAAELNMLVSLFDYFGFDEAYILLLLAHSMEKAAPIKYAYTIAVSNYDKGITTYEQLISELERLEKKNFFEQKMKKLFGIDSRTLTAKEKRFFDEWQKYNYELVLHAYEITVDSTGKAAMPYMNRVLVSFEESGIKTVEEALEKSKQFKENKAREDENNKGFDTDEFFNIALTSSYKKLHDKNTNN